MSAPRFPGARPQLALRPDADVADLAVKARSDWAAARRATAPGAVAVGSPVHEANGQAEDFRVVVGTLNGPANRTGLSDDPTFRPGTWLRKQAGARTDGKLTEQQTALPHSRHLQDCCHIIPLDCPDAWFALLAPFLSAGLPK